MLTGMDIVLSEDAAKALAENLRIYTEDIDVMDEDRSLEMLIAIGFMFSDILSQAGLEESQLTEAAKQGRQRNQYYVPIARD